MIIHNVRPAVKRKFEARINVGSIERDIICINVDA